MMCGGTASLSKKFSINDENGFILGFRGSSKHKMQGWRGGMGDFIRCLSCLLAQRMGTTERHG
jgi:hypothetical protein